MTPWYRGGPKFWSKWINPRPLTKFAKRLDNALVGLVLTIFLLSLFEAIESFTMILIYILFIVLIVHIYGLIFRTKR